MSHFLIIKCGQTYENICAQHGCFESWIAAGLGVPCSAMTVVSVFEGELLPATLANIDGIVITGSPAMVTDRQPWSEATARWLHDEIIDKCTQVPVLGICYGHQLIAHALGGHVDYNPRGREIGTVMIQATSSTAEDPLFSHLPTAFHAQLTHRQSVIRLPPNAVLLATSELEAHQAYRVGDRVWGVQFHPEFTPDIMRAYIDLLAERMASEGLNAAQIAAAVTDAPVAVAVLRRFADFCRR